MGSSGFRLLLALGATITVTLSCSMANALGAYPGANGRIAYVGVVDPETDSEIYSVLPDGTDPTRLTDDSITNLAPSWSADGTQITWSSPESDHLSTIYVMDADGANVRPIASSEDTNPGPSFSPNGNRLVYGGPELVTVGLEGRSPRRLVSGFAYFPEYSPNGRRIVFFGQPKSRPGGRPGIWTVRKDGSRLRRLAHPNASSDYSYSSPDFSPDGSQIVFVREEVGHFATEVMIMNADGTDKRPIPGTRSWSNPAWSPAGDRIAISSPSRNNLYFGCVDVHSIAPDGSDSRQVTQNCYSTYDTAFEPTWQPLP